MASGQIGNDKHTQGMARPNTGPDPHFQQLPALSSSWQQTLGTQFRPLFTPASATLDLASSFNLLMLRHEGILSEFKNQARKKSRSQLPAETAVRFSGAQSERGETAKVVTK